MSDLISRSALLAELARNSIVKIFVIGEKSVWDIVKDQPTIEAVPVVHGEWILHRIGAGHMWECSVCHKRPDIYITNNTNFCPNCGAKMKE